MTPTPGAPSRFDHRHLALAGIAAPILFTVGVVAAGLTWPGYRHAAQNISDLGGTDAPYALVQNANFIVFGLMVVALAVGLWRVNGGRGAAGAGPVLLGYFGVMVVTMGLAPCTPGCADGTAADLVHVVAALSGFVAFAVAALLAWRRSRSQPDASWYAAYSAVTGMLTLVLMGAWVLASEAGAAQWRAGALQRLFVAAVLVWLGVTGARALRGLAP